MYLYPQKRIALRSASGLRRLVPIVLAVLLFASSCLAPSDLAPKSLPSVIKIGLAAPFEGAHRQVGYDAIYAARLATREINATGGINGWRLELVAYDDRGDAELAAQVADNLTIDPQVVVVIGHYLPATTAFAGPIYGDAGMPHLVIGDGATPDSTAWHLAPPPAKVAAAMVAVGLTQGASSADIWVDTRHDAGALEEALHGHLRDQGVEPAPVGEADVVFSLLESGETASRLGDRRDAGWAGMVVAAQDYGAAAFLDAGTDMAVGTEIITPYPLPGDLADTQSWMAAYRTVGPHVPAPGPYALPTYEAVYLVAEVLSSLSDDGALPDRASVGRAVGEVVCDGWLGTIGWSTGSHWASMPLYHYRWAQDGAQLVQVFY